MERRPLGRTLDSLPAIGQGTTGTGPFSAKDDTRDLDRVRVLRQGIALEMNFIDTAELYGGGHGEEIAGRAIAGAREKVFLSSKFNPSNNTAAGIERALEGSLRRLRTDYLDMYQVHWPNPSIPLGETLGALARLVEKGKIRHVGLSNFSLPELEQACTLVDIVSVQVEYNLTDRSIEFDLLPFCEQNNVTVIAYSPLDRVHSLGAHPAIVKLAEKYGRTASQIMLSWVVSRKSVVALTMTTQMDHLLESAAATDFTLEPEDLAALGDATKCEVLRIPTREIEVIPGTRPVYLSLKEAEENVQDLIPHPLGLAENIRRYGIEKPIRVARLAEGSYRLTGEHLRFWAWVIAYGWECPIPAYVVT